MTRFRHSQSPESIAGVATARTVGLLRRAGSFGAFFEVHMTISEPFHVNTIGTLRGVPSLAT